MNQHEQKSLVSNAAAAQIAKKVYTAPSVKVYGNISELVQGTGHRSTDAGHDDFTSGS